MTLGRTISWADCRRMAKDVLRRGGATTVGVWIAYVTAVTAAANIASHYSGMPDVSPSLLHGFVESVDEAPPMARWDSVWFYGIADEGYTGHRVDSRHTPGFLPLYPLLMRTVTAVTGIDYFTAGLWVSRFALLAVLALLPVAANDCRDGEPISTRAVQLSLVAFPTAFLLAAVYTESLYLSLALAAFVLARRDRLALAAGAAFLASLTRLHGLGLVPAFGALAWIRWRGGRRTAWILAPAFGAASAYAGLALYFWRQFGDPFRYLTAKQEGWGTRLAAPWQTLDHAISQLEQAADHPELGTLLKGLELPCFFLIVLSIAVFSSRRTAPEALFTFFGLALSLFSGSLWGLPRFTLVFFPVFVVVATLERRRIWWYAYLMTGGLMQACLLVNYVNFGGPPP